jgi:hypothetical protein
MNEPRKYVSRFTFVLIPAIVCLLIIPSVQAAEPVYDGKALSEWLLALHADLSDEEQIAATQQNVDPAKLLEQKQSRAQEAIRQIGTNGLPTLLDIISVEQWDRKKVLGKLKSKDFQKAAGNKDIPTEVFRGLAVDGFGILSTNAEPAIPQLTKLLRESPECRLEVASVLAQIGPKGFAVLTNAINDEDLAGALVFAIGQKGGGDLQTVTRILIAALKNPEPTIRGNAAYFLSGKDATLAVPALIPMLDDSEYYPRQRASLALGSFGPAAKSAVPKLWSVYTNSPDVFVMGALKSIDREAAVQAEAFLVNSSPLNGARHGYTRTLLPNGKELIVGGYLHTEIPTIINRELSNAELLDPKTEKWTETGELNAARYDHTATLLPDGKVLVSGGYKTSSVNIRQSFWEGNKLVEKYGPVMTRSAVTNAELYDPAIGTWTVVTNK